MSKKKPIAAVVTGAASGIGREIAKQLALRKSRIVVADIDLDGANETVGLVRALGGEACAVKVDVSDSDEVAALARHANDWLGRVELLVNNAGVIIAGEMTELSLAEVKRVMDINLWGVLHGCHHFVPLMKAAGGGKILNTGSLAGTVAIPQLSAYSASKAAVVSLSESLHSELARYGISVTVLCPSFTRTNIIEADQVSDEKSIRLGRSIIERLGASARSVAQVALEATDRGKLYAVPGRHGKFVWRSKRLAPEVFKHAMTLANRIASSTG